MLSSRHRPALQVVGLSGSPTHPSRTTALLRAALRTLAPAGAVISEIELRDLPPAALLGAQVQDPQIQAAIAKLREADVVLVATPIYQAAYSGLLKSFLDLLPQNALRDKRVLPLATGGSAGHLLALDYALKPVLGALGARHILDAVFAVDSQFSGDAVQGRHPLPEVLERLSRALAPLLPADADTDTDDTAAPEALRMSC